MTSKMPKQSICENNYGSLVLKKLIVVVIRGAWLQLSTGRILKLPKDISVSHNRRIRARE